MTRIKLERMGLLKIAAVVMLSGTILFTFTACGKTETPVESPVTIEQTTDIATEDNAVADVDLIENADDISKGKTSVAEETVTLAYMESGNGEYELENQEETTIEEYKMEKPLVDLVNTEIETEITEEIIAETREDGTLIVSADDLDIKTGYTLQYSYDKDTKEGKAIYMYEYLTWDGMLDEDVPASGINVILTETAGKYEIKGFEDIFGNDIAEIMLYRGEVIGWSCGTEDATETDFEFNDKARFSTDMDLYPVLDTEYEVVDEGIFSEIQHSYVVGLYGHKVPKQKLTWDGNTKGIYHIVKGTDEKPVLVTDEGEKIDPATGENPEKAPKKNPENTTPKTPSQPTTPTPKPPTEPSTGPVFDDPMGIGWSDLPVNGNGGVTGNISVE